MSTVRPYPDCPLAVAYGLGVDSTAMLIEFSHRGIRPDLILFADTGGEKPETYQYMSVIQPYLQSVGFPEVVTVRYQPKRAVYHTLEAQCLHTGTLPSLAYGGKSCSLKYKRSCQDKLILATYLPAELIKRRQRVVRAIGFDAGEERRTYAHVVKAIGLDATEEHRRTWARSAPSDGKRPSRQAWLDEHYFHYWYPLMDWGYDRNRCKQVPTPAEKPERVSNDATGAFQDVKVATSVWHPGSPPGHAPRCKRRRSVLLEQWPWTYARRRPQSHPSMIFPLGGDP